MALIAHGHRKRPLQRPARGAGIPLLLLLLSGCTDASRLNEPAKPAGFGEGDGIRLPGLVVDTEFVAISGVSVSIPELEFVAVTDEAGGFLLVLPHAGDYVFVFEKAGYATLERKLAVREAENERVLATLTPIATDVPYRESRLVTTYTQCWVSAGPAGLPCVGLIDYASGQQISQDKLTFIFKVEKPGLSQLLIEILFARQSLGRDAIIVVREPGSYFSAAQKSWLLQSGGPPIRARLIPGEVGVGGRERFEQPSGVTYMAIIGGWSTNNTIPAAAHLDFRTQTFFSFFYNRPPSPDFTMLPDN